MTTKEREARQQVVELRSEARTMLDQAEAEKRDLTEQEAAQVKELTQQAENLSDKLTRGDFDKEDRNLPPVVQVSSEPDGMAEFRSYLRGEYRAGPGPAKLLPTTAGGVMAPEGFVAEVIKALNEASVMRQVARVIAIGEKSTRIPRLTSGVTATWEDETDAIGLSEAAFDQVTLTPHKLAVLTQASNELLADSAINVDSFLAELFAEEFAAVEDDAFFNGNGTGKPVGILLDDSETSDPIVPAVLTEEAGPTYTVTVANIFSLYDALAPQYRPNAAWIMHPSTLSVIRQLTDGSGRYLLVDSGLSAGAPNTILGHPVHLSSNMPEIGSGNKSILFGDIAKAYYIADRIGLDVQRSADRYFEKDLTAFRGIKRTDGQIALPEAARVLIHDTDSE